MTSPIEASPQTMAFVRRIEPFIKIAIDRRSATRWRNESLNDVDSVARLQLNVPCELLPALDRVFRVEAAYKRQRRSVLWAGGYNHVPMRISVELALAIDACVKSLHVDRSYVNNVIEPMCMVLWIREQRLCTLDEAERLFHQNRPLSEDEIDRERALWRRRDQEDRALFRAAAERELRQLRVRLESIDADAHEFAIDEDTGRELLPYADHRFDFLTREDVDTYTEAVTFGDPQSIIDRQLDAIYNRLSRDERDGAMYAARGNSLM